MTEPVVCAGWCTRRGPEVRLVDSVDQITCTDCLDVHAAANPDTRP